MKAIGNTLWTVLLTLSVSIPNFCVATTSRFFPAFVSGRTPRSDFGGHKNLKHETYQRRCPAIPCPATTTSSTRTMLALRATQDKENTKTTPEVWTMEQLEAHAEQEGVQLSISTLGPGFRTVARSTTNSSAILGYGEGFVRPAGDILHLDKMEIFQKMVQRVKAENPDFRGGGSTFGVGLLFGYQALLHGLEKGCTVAEFLAIDDEDFQHKRLVRYYSRAGFKIIKYVGDDFQDIPDRMVWGGCGTLMRGKIEDLLPLWSAILNKSAKKSNK